MDCSTPGLPVHHQLHSLLKLMSIESVMPSNHLILCCPLLLPPSIFPTIKVFSNESVLHNRWPKYWSFSFSISPSNEYLGLISFRMDWLDLLAVQGTLKSLLQYHISIASVLQHSALFIVQLSHLHMTTGKTIALTRWTFVGKVMSLLFNMLSRFVIAFLPRSKHLLISWLQSPSAVIWEPKKIKSVTVSIVSPSICHEVMGLDAIILVFWSALQIRSTHHTLMPWHFLSTLNKDKNLSSEKWAGVKIREDNPELLLPWWILCLFVCMPLLTSLPKKSRAAALHLPAQSPSESKSLLK